MNMKKITMITMYLGLGLLGLASFTGCGQGDSSGPTTAVSADGRCEHQIKVESCPFCNPEMVEAEGFCGSHGFAEAICAQCKPGIKVAFRAMGDWCDEHKLPESQCIECNPELAQNIQDGVHGGAMPTTGGDHNSNCEHGITEAKCPYCIPSLIDSEGYCNGHDVAEALCVKCRPFMKTAFVAMGDWCDEHTTPESQCKACNP